MKPNGYIKYLASRSTGYGYIVEKETHKLEFINPPLAMRKGLNVEEVKGQLCHSTLFGYEAPCPFCTMDQTPLEQECPPRYFYHEKENSHYILDGHLSRLEGQDYFIHMVTGITEEMEEIALLKDSIVAEQMVTACANTLGKGAQAMDQLLSIVCHFFAGSHATVWKRDLENGQMFLHGLYQKSQETYPFAKGDQLAFVADALEEGVLTQDGYLFLTQEQLKEVGHNNWGTIADQSIFVSKIHWGSQEIGLLVLYNLEKHLDSLHHINRVKTFIANSLAIETRINTLEAQNQLAQMVLSCVATLEGQGSYEQAIQGLMEVVDGYFQGDRCYILRRDVDGVAMEFEYSAQNTRSTYAEVNFASAQVIDQWFLRLGDQESGDTLAISSVEEEMCPEFGDTFEYQLLLKDQVFALLGVRLFEKGQARRFFLIDNPRRHLDKVELLKSISSFVESHLDRGKMLKKLEQLSYTDSLTGLYNRNFYQHYLEHLALKKPPSFGLVFGDVNGLKRANDNFGHEFGDILLTWSGHFLRDHLGGMVFRIGGDEYVCFLENIPEEKFREKVATLQGDLDQKKEQHISLGCLWKAQVEDMKELMKEADLLMYQEKKAYYQEKAKDSRSMKQVLEDCKKEILHLKEEMAGQG